MKASSDWFVFLLLCCALLASCNWASSSNNTDGDTAENSAADLEKEPDGRSGVATPRDTASPPPATTITTFGGTPTPASTLLPIQGHIAFVSDRDGNDEIYVMNADGSKQTRLTNNPVSDRHPSFSPDRQHIVFQSNRDGNFQIYRMNVDGSEQTRITNNEFSDTRPRWSPDGKWIAFESGRNGYQNIYIMEADGSNQIQLAEHSAIDAFPTWSANGEEILFASTRDNREGIYDNQLYTVSIAGGKITRLIDSPGTYDFPAWSPDGRHIAFVTRHPLKLSLLDIATDEVTYLIADDPSVPIASIPAQQTPAWLSDSEHIVFAWSKDGNSELYNINIASRQLTRLTNNSAADYSPDW